MHCIPLILSSLLLVLFVEGNKKAAEEARWLVAESNWGTLSYASDDQPLSMIASFADSKGHIFFYLMGPQSFDACLTLSEAALEPYDNFAKAACGVHGSSDPEDPRCAKLSISGKIKPCEESCDLGKEALFERHPEMKEWPASHHFTVHEFTLTDLWMIYSYGGGSNIIPEDFFNAKPKHHRGGFPPNSDNEDAMVAIKNDNNNNNDPIPNWDQKVERARWIMSKSLWTTVSTISVRLNGTGWGNIRSLVDGTSLEDSSGKPIFYLPSPDPTSIDVSKNSKISLQLSEAALAERLDKDGKNICDGKDAMDPLCAELLISGIATKVSCPKMLKNAQKAFKERHPLAPWLAKGGAHTGGDYYTIEPTKIMLLDYYGGATEVDVNDYLNWKKEESNNDDSSSMVTMAMKRMLRGGAV